MPEQFFRELDRVEANAISGDVYSQKLIEQIYIALAYLRGMSSPPTEDIPPLLKRIISSRKNVLWRVGHDHTPKLAVRLVCWFPPNTTRIAVALFAGDKARVGDSFYDGVGVRADGLIDQWKRETGFQAYSQRQMIVEEEAKGKRTRAARKSTGDHVMFQAPQDDLEL